MAYSQVNFLMAERIVQTTALDYDLLEIPMLVICYKDAKLISESS